MKYCRMKKGKTDGSSGKEFITGRKIQSGLERG